MADNENLRKRTERDMAAAKKYGALGLARDLLASIDNLETAMSHMPENKEDMDETLKNILIGVEMSAREFATVLERHQITKLTPVGEKFDYNLHQAMFEVPTDEVAPGMVVQVVQSGYMLHDRLLRPPWWGSLNRQTAATPATDKDSRYICPGQKKQNRRQGRLSKRQKTQKGHCLLYRKNSTYI